MISDSELPYSQVPEGSNSTTQLILSRRSVRERYSNRPVEHESVEEIIRCGLASPSSKNARPWRLHIVDDRNTLTALANAVATADGADTYVPRDPLTGQVKKDWPSSVAESADTLASVPIAIFIENLGAFSRGRETLASVPRDNLRGSLVAYTFEVLGIGTAIMNMWLTANSLGIQAAFMGDICVAEKEIAKRLGIKKDLVGVLALGYSDEPPNPARVHYDVTDASRVVWHKDL
jgi:nitroreductase